MIGGRRTAGSRSSCPTADGTLTAVAVLPPEGSDPCAVDAGLLAAVQAGRPEQVSVQLPCMRIAQTHGLLDDLAALGLPVHGDFPGLGRDGLVISDVVQKTFLDVDENGTEAAAATGVSMETSMPVPTDPVVFDRPFVLLLTDTATRSPLFLTVVRDPA